MPNKANGNYFNSPLYKHPTLYDDIMWWKDDDIKFWKSVIKQTKSKTVLEICCGTGRLGVPIINDQIDYYGLDISQSFINFFRKKIIKFNYDINKIMCGDATNFNLNKSFDFIFIGFNSLAHLLTNKEVMDCFRCIQSHMHDNSIFGIDIFMPSHELISNNQSEKNDIMDFIDSRNNQKLNILELTDYNSDTEVNHITWEFINQNKESQFTYDFDMRMFFPDTLNRLLIDSKFRINHFYGNYQSQKFNGHSDKQIYLCSK